MCYCHNALGPTSRMTSVMTFMRSVKTRVNTAYESHMNKGILVRYPVEKLQQTR